MNVLLCSGGYESAALAYQLRPDVCLTVDYSQPAFLGESRAAKALCAELGLKHENMRASLYQTEETARREPHWWPFRNQMLITAAAVRYAHEPSVTIIIGVVKDDIFADCGPEFILAMDRVLSIQEGEFRVSAPGLGLTTLELLKDSRFPVELIALTFSCHWSDFPCGVCEGCKKNNRITKTLRARAKLSLAASS